MDFRKTDKSNLEDKKVVFFLVGMLLILSFAYTSFNIKSYTKSAYDFQMSEEEDLMELPPVTTPPEVKPPPPPPPEKTKAVEPEIELVEDEVITEEPDFEDLDLANLEIDDEPIGDEPPEQLDDTPVMFVSNMPHFPECSQFEGNDAKAKCTQKMIHSFIIENFEMPAIAQEMGYSGKLYLQFTVSREGNVTDVKVLKGLVEVVDKEAIRVVKSLPKFIPGKNLDKPKSVLYTIPFDVTID